MTYASLPWILRYNFPHNDLIFVQWFSITQWYSGVGCLQDLQPNGI